MAYNWAIAYINLSVGYVAPFVDFEVLQGYKIEIYLNQNLWYLQL